MNLTDRLDLYARKIGIKPLERAGFSFVEIEKTNYPARKKWFFGFSVDTGGDERREAAHLALDAIGHQHLAELNELPVPKHDIQGKWDLVGWYPLADCDDTCATFREALHIAIESLPDRAEGGAL